MERGFAIAIKVKLRLGLRYLVLGWNQLWEPYGLQGALALSRIMGSTAEFPQLYLVCFWARHMATDGWILEASTNIQW